MAQSGMSRFFDKQTQVVLFSSTAIALYGYDQGMMSLINTNRDYLRTMGLPEDSSLIGIIVSVYYLGCALGAIIFSSFADRAGRKLGIFACLTTAVVGNIIMFIAGLGGMGQAMTVMLIGRVVMGLGVGGIDSVVPVYTAELSEDDARGEALAKEFQANIFGLNMAFIINVALTHQLGKENEWAWRIPIIVMQVYPILLFSGATLLPETPRWCIMKGNDERAKRSIKSVFGDGGVDEKIKEMKDARKKEEEDGLISYADMLWPSGSQFHPTVVTVMGQVNQALTGYGAVSVYGPQIFQLLGFAATDSEYITMGNYIFYFLMMTFAWMIIDRKGRRWLLVVGAFWLSISFGLLTIFGGLSTAQQDGALTYPLLATSIPGTVVLYLATSVFGIGWLVPPWLIPTEIYPSTARANGAAVSVVIWGFANFAITLLTPYGFNELKYWLFLVFCATNAFAGWWTYLYCPESGNRTFEENQEFFEKARHEGSWNVIKVDHGSHRYLDHDDGGQRQESDEETPKGRGNNKKNNGKKKSGGEREPLLASQQRVLPLQEERSSLQQVDSEQILRLQ